jgi:hypothetical protein
MGKYNKILIMAFIIICLAGCKTITKLPIEKNEIWSFKIIEIYGNEQDYIIISGLISHSAYNYKTINVNNDSQFKYILMYAELSTLNKNGSGRFNITIPIEKNINKVFFGNNNEIIWERKSIETLTQREKLLELQKYISYNDVIKRFGEPDAVIGSGFLIIQYALNNNRKAILNFGTNNDGLLQLIEVFGQDDEDTFNENIILDL